MESYYYYVLSSTEEEVFWTFLGSLTITTRTHLQATRKHHDLASSDQSCRRQKLLFPCGRTEKLKNNLNTLSRSHRFYYVAELGFEPCAICLWSPRP